jgi:hypothetical protein
VDLGAWSIVLYININFGGSYNKHGQFDLGYVDEFIGPDNVIVLWPVQVARNFLSDTLWKPSAAYTLMFINCKGPNSIIFLVRIKLSSAMT